MSVQVKNAFRQCSKQRLNLAKWRLLEQGMQR